MPADRVILNADDLGLCPAVNRGIIAAWQAGAVGDSTVFANASALPELLAPARALGLPVGVHLNLTYGHPLCNPADIPALVDIDGRFVKRQQWVLPLPTEQVRRELTRQLERVSALVGQPSHLDSHHHVHAYPEVLSIVIELARAHRLPVRATMPQMRANLRAAGLATPDHFSMEFYGENATVATLQRLVDDCPGGTLEIMAHPGLDDPAIPGSYRAGRARELAALTDPQWRAYLAERGITIVGFDSLG